MKKLILAFVLPVMAASVARAGLTLGTSNPSSSPLFVTAGSTSGPMSINVVSDNPPNDVMAAWQFTLAIVPMAGSNGTLTFHSPVTGTPSNPANYVFGTNGLGIDATNQGSTLDANDFYNPSVAVGVAVPGSPGANLLQANFAASANASGIFGIYAEEGAANTIWTDSNFTTQFFSNVPSGNNEVLIGEVIVPESSTVVLLGIGLALVTGWHWRMKRKAEMLPV